VRPFSLAAGVNCRGYSLGLQRVMVDFGADLSFARAAEKVKEHYQIDVNSSAIRARTEGHGRLMALESEMNVRMPAAGVRELIAELDGSFVPIVEIAEGTGDKRKRRKLKWEEAKLGVVGVMGSRRRRYSATMRGAEEAGRQWRSAAIEMGAGCNTHLHCLGDGAGWIVGQVKAQFGAAASYLVDFYHVSEYVAQAGQAFAGAGTKQWLREQQEKLKENRVGEVLSELARHREGEAKSEEETAIRKCERYLGERVPYLDYAGAIKKGLPIGSGEVESGHRTVIQPRLKLSGAWWTEENAEKMLAMRVVRANGEWEAYWKGQRQAHA